MSDLVKEHSGMQHRPTTTVEGEIVDPRLLERALQARNDLKATIERDEGGDYFAEGRGHIKKAGRSFIRMPNGEDVSRPGASVFHLNRAPLPGIPPEVEWAEFNNIDYNEVDHQEPYIPSNSKDELRLKLDPRKLPPELKAIITGANRPSSTNLLNDLRIVYHFIDDRVEKRIRLSRHLVNPNARPPQVWEPASEANVWKSVPMTESDYTRATNTLNSLNQAISGVGPGVGIPTGKNIARSR